MPPRALSILNLQVLLEAVTRDFPFTGAVKSIVALNPTDYSGEYTVIDSKDCEYNYKMVVVFNEFGTTDVHTAVLQSTSCSDLNFSKNINIAQPLGGVCCSGFENPGSGCDPGC